MAECAKGVYRPRQPRETPFYRIVEEHFERFEQVYPERYEDRYGYLRPVIRETVYKYLNCGDLKQGFARVRCPECGHEFLLAFSCKGRYFCSSCHTKRAVAFAEWLHTTVLLPVPHRQIVLTIPKMLRIYFRYDRRLLGDLCRVAAGVIVESFRVLLAAPQAQPGLVVCVHTYGELLNHHPHIHVMATDGAFTPDGVFHALPTMSLAPMEELLRHRVFKMLMKKGLLSSERVKLMESWEHSGFNIDASVRIGADDATGRENLARYLIRAPFSGEKITYNAAASTVIYQTKRSTGANGNEVLFDALDFIAAVTSHIPNRGEHNRFIMHTLLCH